MQKILPKMSVDPVRSGLILALLKKMLMENGDISPINVWFGYYISIFIKVNTGFFVFPYVSIRIDYREISLLHNIIICLFPALSISSLIHNNFLKTSHSKNLCEKLVNYWRIIGELQTKLLNFHLNIELYSNRVSTNEIFPLTVTVAVFGLGGWGSFRAGGEAACAHPITKPYKCWNLHRNFKPYKCWNLHRNFIPHKISLGRANPHVPLVPNV